MKKDSDGHTPRKRFGQNFLIDPNVIDNIVNAIAPKKDDRVIEIGPGKGAITEPLLSCCPSLQVIELDRDLAARLRNQQIQYPNFKIHEADAMKVDFAQLANQENHKPYPKDKLPALRIVGNLPYNISTPLLFHLLKFRSSIRDMHFMLQKEVVDRLCAEPNQKRYGRLTVMVQYCAQVEDLFAVPPTCFSPPPKVNSAVVRLNPFETLPHPAIDEDIFATLVSTCFQFRRKTLRNSLRKLCDNDTIAKLAVDTTVRPENLSVAEFVDLANQIASYQSNLHDKTV